MGRPEGSTSDRWTVHEARYRAGLGGLIVGGLVLILAGFLSNLDLAAIGAVLIVGGAGFLAAAFSAGTAAPWEELAPDPDPDASPAEEPAPYAPPPRRVVPPAAPVARPAPRTVPARPVISASPAVEPEELVWPPGPAVVAALPVPIEPPAAPLPRGDPAPAPTPAEVAEPVPQVRPPDPAPRPAPIGIVASVPSSAVSGPTVGPEMAAGPSMGSGAPALGPFSGTVDLAPDPGRPEPMADPEAAPTVRWGVPSLPFLAATDRSQAIRGPGPIAAEPWPPPLDRSEEDLREEIERLRHRVEELSPPVIVPGFTVLPSPVPRDALVLVSRVPEPPVRGPRSSTLCSACGDADIAGPSGGNRCWGCGRSVCTTCFWRYGPGPALHRCPECAGKSPGLTISGGRRGPLPAAMGSDDGEWSEGL